MRSLEKVVESFKKYNSKGNIFKECRIWKNMFIKIIETHTDIIKTDNNMTTPILPKVFANL